MRCGVWSLVLRPGLEPVPPEYRPFNRVTSSSFRVITVNLRAMQGGGYSRFIFNILAGLSGQLRAPAALATGKYSPVGLVVERGLSESTEGVWTFSIRDKYLASAKNRTTIPRTSFPWPGPYIRGVQSHFMRKVNQKTCIKNSAFVSLFDCFSFLFVSLQVG
jgi:hypothetical protein